MSVFMLALQIICVVGIGFRFKDGFEDYMLKEIYEQPNAIRETIGSRLPENEFCNFEDLNFKSWNHQFSKRRNL